MDGWSGNSDGCSADGILRSMAQFGERSERRRSIMRSLTARRDFQTETGPKDCHAARQGRHSRFGDAEYSHTHRNRGVHAVRQKTVAEKKRLLGLFCKFDRDRRHVCERGPHPKGYSGLGARSATRRAISSPNPSRFKPSMTPSRSAAERFWLTFHLPSREAMGISTPTIAPI